MNVTLSEFRAGIAREKRRREKRREAEYNRYVKRKRHANPKPGKGAFYDQTSQPLLLLPGLRRRVRFSDEAHADACLYGLR